MPMLALSWLPVPSLVLFTLLTSASVQALSSRCEQDDDSISLMQAEKSWKDAVGSDTFIGTGAKPLQPGYPIIPAALSEVQAPVPTEERKQSLVQRMWTFTSNKHQGSMMVLIPLGIVLLVLSAVFCACVGYQFSKRGESEDNSMTHGINQDGLSVDTSPFLGAKKNATNWQTSPTMSPDLRRQRSPLVPVPTPQVDMQNQMSSLTPPRSRSRTPTRAAALVPELVNLSEETRLGIHHASLGDAAEHAALDIVAASAQPMLRMSIIPHQRSGYSLVLENVQTSQRVCTIHSPATSDATIPYQILNGHGSEHGYFRLADPGRIAYDVVIGGVSCFEITGSSDNPRFLVNDKLSQKPRVLAITEINHNDFPGGEHLEFRILPGTDVALVVGVILAIMVFGNH